MRIVAIAEKHTVEALSALGVEPYPVDSASGALDALQELSVNKNNVILISAGIAQELFQQISSIEARFKDSVIVVVPDMSHGIDIDIDKMIAAVVGVKV